MGIITNCATAMVSDAIKRLDVSSSKFLNFDEGDKQVIHFLLEKSFLTYDNLVYVLKYCAEKQIKKEEEIAGSELHFSDFEK